MVLNGLTAKEIHAELAHLGVSPRLARRLLGAVMRQGEVPREMPEVSPRLLSTIREQTRLPRLELVEKVVSPNDQFAKYLFRGDGPEPFEAVRIPLLHRPEDKKYVVCVSSQVGCAMGCGFCATGRLGFRRNLAPWEMVDQVARIQADSSYPVRGVVFMGMGEPMLNYDHVMQAAAVLSDSSGLAIGAKTMTISTVGIVPGIRRFTAERRIYRLVISLVSADPAKRRELMPVEKAYSTEELLDAVREYHAAIGRRVTLAWIAMSGVNLSEDDARQLAELTRGLPVKIDLIDVNDPTGRFQPPSPAELKAFRDHLTRHLGVPIDRRYSGGRDIHAACGMLAGRS